MVGNVPAAVRRAQLGSEYSLDEHEIKGESKRSTFSLEEIRRPCRRRATAAAATATASLILFSFAVFFSPSPSLVAGTICTPLSDALLSFLLPFLSFSSSDSCQHSVSLTHTLALPIPFSPPQRLFLGCHSTTSPLLCWFDVGWPTIKQAVWFKCASTRVERFDFRFWRLYGKRAHFLCFEACSRSRSSAAAPCDLDPTLPASMRSIPYRRHMETASHKNTRLSVSHGESKETKRAYGQKGQKGNSQSTSQLAG